MTEEEAIAIKHFLDKLIESKEPSKPREWWIEFGPWKNAIQVHPSATTSNNPQHYIVHVREVLSSEPETSLDAAERAYARRSQPKDPAAPPDQQP